MAKNEARRAELQDAAIRVIASKGSRGLTHRAVDAEAGVPTGTSSNYFRTRQALIDAIVMRIGERLTPEPEVAAALASRRPSKRLYADYLRDIVRRLSKERESTLALFELRLEATRNPDVARSIGGWLRDSYAADVLFTRDAKLPGGAFEIALFHYALDGLMLDQLTTPIDESLTTDRVIDRLVSALLPPKPSTRAPS